MTETAAVLPPRRAAPHALCAAVWAVVAAVGAPVVTAPFVWTGALGFLLAVVVVVALGAAAGGSIGWAFRRTPGSFAAGALGVLPALALPVLTVGAPLPVPGLVVVAGLAAASALVVHGRPARFAGAALAAGSLVFAVVAAGGALARAGTELAAERFGSGVVPYVATTPGFERTSASPTGIGGVALGYEAADGRAFVLSTEPAPDSVTVTPGLQICEIPMVLTDPPAAADPPAGAEADVLACTETAEGWVRESAARRELAVLRGGEIVRVNAELDWGTGQLAGILDGVVAMGDAEYRGMLAAR